MKKQAPRVSAARVRQCEVVAHRNTHSRDKGSRDTMKAYEYLYNLENIGDKRTLDFLDKLIDERRKLGGNDKANGGSEKAILEYDPAPCR